MEAEFCGEGINSRAFSNSFSMNYLGKNLFPDNIPIQGESTPKIPPSTIAKPGKLDNRI